VKERLQIARNYRQRDQEFVRYVQVLVCPKMVLANNFPRVSIAMSLQYKTHPIV